MNVAKPIRVVGHAVFVRTDTPDYAEEHVSFRSLEELVMMFSLPRRGLAFNRVVLICGEQPGFATGSEACEIILEFVSASMGARTPGDAVMVA